MRYILDTNTISDAVADVAIAKHLTERRDGWHPVIPMTVLAEIFEGLGNCPLNRHLASECQFVLDLWERYPRCVVPDNVIGMLAEYQGFPTHLNMLPSYQARVTKQMLREGMVGQFDPAYRFDRGRTKALLEEKASLWQKAIVSDATRRPIATDWEYELKDTPERDWKTRMIVQGYLRLISVQVEPLKVDALAESIWAFPRSVPYWAGTVRLTLYGDWFHDHLRSIPNPRTRTYEQARFYNMMDDMYNLTPCLMAEAVVTNDFNWRQEGQLIFPEVGWHELSFCEPTVVAT